MPQERPPEAGPVANMLLQASQHMNNQYMMINQHMNNQYMINQHMNNQYMINQHISESAPAVVAPTISITVNV